MAEKAKPMMEAYSSALSNEIGSRKNSNWIEVAGGGSDPEGGGGWAKVSRSVERFLKSILNNILLLIIIPSSAGTLCCWMRNGCRKRVTPYNARAKCSFVQYLNQRWDYSVFYSVFYAKKITRWEVLFVDNCFEFGQVEVEFNRVSATPHQGHVKRLEALIKSANNNNEKVRQLLRAWSRKEGNSLDFPLNASTNVYFDTLLWYIYINLFENTSLNFIGSWSVCAVLSWTEKGRGTAVKRILEFRRIPHNHIMK